LRARLEKGPGMRLVTKFEEEFARKFVEGSGVNFVANSRAIFNYSLTFINLKIVP
jgi:hypothetical protein